MVEPGNQDKVVHLTVTIPKLEAVGRQVEFSLVAEGIYQLVGGTTEEARPRTERLIFVQPEMEVQGDYTVEPIQTEITGLEEGVFQFNLHNQTSYPLSLEFCLSGAAVVNHILKGDTYPYTLLLQPGAIQTLDRRIQPRVTGAQGEIFELNWEIIGTYLLEGGATRPAQRRSGSLHFHQEALHYHLEALQTEVEGLEKASFRLKVVNKSHARLELYSHIATPDPTMQYQFNPEKLELHAGQAGFITLMATPVHRAATGRKVKFSVKVEGHFILTSGLRPLAPSSRLEFTYLQPVPPQLELNAESEMQQISAVEPVRYALKLRNPGTYPVQVALKAEALVSPARMTVTLIPVGLSLEGNEERKVLMEIKPHISPYPDNQWLNQVEVTAEPKNNLYRPAQVTVRLVQFQPRLVLPEPSPPSGRNFNWWLLTGGLSLIISSLWFLATPGLALGLVGGGLLLILLAWLGSDDWRRGSPIQVTFVYRPIAVPGREQLILTLMGKNMEKPLIYEFSTADTSAYKAVIKLPRSGRYQFMAKAQTIGPNEIRWKEGNGQGVLKMKTNLSYQVRVEHGPNTQFNPIVLQKLN